MPGSPRTRAEIDQRARGAAIDVHGAELVADTTGALYWPAERLLMVADLHLEKGSSSAAWGRLLPPYDTRETLSRFAGALARYAPRTVVCLGDSLHDRGAHTRLDEDARSSLRALQAQRRWIWITGNHDPSIDRRLGGDVVGCVQVAGVTLRHEPSAGAGAEPEIAGHLHPAARLLQRGASLRRPCFVGTAGRLIMPAFGAFTGGLNVLDAAFGSLIARTDMHVCMLGRDAVYRVPTRQLVED